MDRGGQDSISWSSAYGPRRNQGGLEWARGLGHGGRPRTLVQSCREDLMRYDRCGECGGEKDKRAKMCSDCRFKYNHPRFGRGKYGAGRFSMSGGYVAIRDESGRFMYEHRFLLEKKIGRRLRKDEHVHHRNGIKDDNRIRNLKLMSASEHRKYHASLRVQV